MFKINKIIEYGLYVLAFLLPIQTRWIFLPGQLNGGYWEYGTYSLYASDILLIFILALFIIKKITEKNSKTKKHSLSPFQHGKILPAGYILFLAICLLAISFISIFFAFDRTLAVFKFAQLALGVGLCWLIMQARYDKMKLIFFFFAGVFLQAIISLWQFFTQSDFANKWLGDSLHSTGELGTSIVEAFSGRWLRAYGWLDHPNILGGLLAVSIILLIIYQIKYQNNTSSCYPSLKRGEEEGIFFNNIPPTPLPKGDFNNFDRLCAKIDFFYYLFLIVYFFALFAAFSRAAWIGLAVGIASSLVISIYTKSLIAKKTVLVSILIFALIGFILFNIYGDLVRSRAGSQSRVEAISNLERLDSFKQASLVIKQNKFFGAGTGNYTLALSKIMPQQPSYVYQPTHNTFLLIFTEIGALGLVFYLAIFVLLFYFLFKDKRNVYYVSVLIAILTISLVDHWWWSLHFGIILFWFVLGIITKEISNFKE